MQAPNITKEKHRKKEERKKEKKKLTTVQLQQVEEISIPFCSFTSQINKSKENYKFTERYFLSSSQETELCKQVGMMKI